MAIPNIDEYLKKTISTQMTVLLANPYIIKEAVLSDIDPLVRESFIETYCGKNPKQEIPVSFTYSPEHSNTGQILIQYKGGEEDESSIGNLVGSTNDDEGNTQQDDIVWTTAQRIDEDGHKEVVIMAETSLPVKTLISSNKLALGSGAFTIEDNHVYTPYTPQLGTIIDEGLQDKLTYIPFRDKQEVVSRDGVLRGFDLTEVYTIDSLASNIDMLRCIDNVLKAILVMMRQNVNEQTGYRLAELTFQGVDLLDPINNTTDSARGNQIYYRRAEVTYGVTYSINTTYGTKINQLIQSLSMEGELVSDGKK